MFDRLDELEVRIVAEDYLVLMVEEFGQIMKTEFAKLLIRRFSGGAHSFSYIEDSVSKSKMVKKNKANLDGKKGNGFEDQTLKPGYARKKEVVVD